MKDYIQMLISEEDSTEIEIGSYHHVPAGAHGQITISTDAIQSSSTIRFVYVKCGGFDRNGSVAMETRS